MDGSPAHQRRTGWSSLTAAVRLQPVMTATGLRYVYPSNYNNGIKLAPYNNTWLRKRESGFLIEITYLLNGKRLMRHVEPWVNYPSDQLIAKMMLLPLEVTNNE